MRTAVINARSRETGLIEEFELHEFAGRLYVIIVYPSFQGHYSYGLPTCLGKCGHDIGLFMSLFILHKLSEFYFI